MNETLSLHVFTDPTCPYAYSAEPIRWRLKWLYGDQLTWSTTMIVLSGYAGETSSLTPEKIAPNFTLLREKYGMPIDDTVRPRLAPSILACRSYVAVRRHAPEKADALLRNLRVAGMNGQLVDEQPVIDAAAQQAGLDPKQVVAWMLEPETEQALSAGAEATRQPTAVAKAFRRKISETSTGRLRYSAPSYQFMKAEKIEFELPGYWPLEAYEAAVDNLIPSRTRADDPASVEEVLRWAETPLATIEVATICARDISEVRADLEKVATFKAVGQDGFWSLAG